MLCFILIYNKIYDVTGNHHLKSNQNNLGRISLHCEFRVLYSRLFLIMATFRNDYQDIFGEEEVNDFEGFSREELDFNSDIEVQKNTVQ